MAIESVINGVLTGAAGVVALVGTNIYPVVVPRSFAFVSPMGALVDAVSYQVVSGSSDITLDNKAWQEKRVQIDAWSKVYANTKAIQAAISAALDGYTQPGGGLLLAVSDITLDGFEEADDVFRCMVEYQVSYTGA